MMHTQEPLVQFCIALVASVALSSCANFAAAWEGLATGRTVYRPARTPVEEAAWFKFPLDIPAEARTTIPANTAAAIQLAMDDFRPPTARPVQGATPGEDCLRRRESYDVVTASADEAVILVRFVLARGACEEFGPLLDAGATYAVDLRKWRILAIQRP